MKGIESIIEISGLGKDSLITQELFDKYIEILLYVLRDYTTDRRGDIGSIVREASMDVMQNIL